MHEETPRGQRNSHLEGLSAQSPYQSGRCQTSFWIINKSNGQKISTDVQDLTNTTSPLDLIDIYTILYPTGLEFVFSSAHGTLTRTDNILVHKISLIRLKRIQIKGRVSDHSGIKSGINDENIPWKYPNFWKVNLTYLWTNHGSKRELENINWMKMRTQYT